MNTIGASFGGVVWIIIGLLVAASHQLLNAGTLSAVGTAILAIVAWPLVLLGVDIRI